MEKQTAGKQGNALRTYRYTLLNRKAEFLVALGINFRELGESAREAGADPAISLFEEFVHVRNRALYGELRQVDDALDRLEWGEYGICEDCGNPISPKHLQDAPWEKYCRICLHTANLSADEIVSMEMEVNYAETTKRLIQKQ